MRAAARIGSVAACLALAVAGCGGSSHKQTTTPTGTGTTDPAASASPTPSPTQHRTDLTSLFEDEGLLQYGGASNDAATNEPNNFAILKALGVQTVRVFIQWDFLAPDPSSKTTPKVNLTSQSAYSAAFWTYYDAIDQTAAADHIHVLFDVGAPAPDWALGSDPKTTTGSWKPNAADYGDFMRVLGQRFSGSYTPPGAAKPLPRVTLWSIWNEPNGHFLTPNTVNGTPYSPRLYRNLVDAAWSALAATGHTPQNDTILIGETAPRGVPVPGNSSGIPPLPFIRDFYCVSSAYKPLTGSTATALGCPSSGSVSSFKAQNPALFEASGWADHPYADTTPPTEKSPDASEDADFASLGYLESTLDSVARAYGSSTQFPIYSTEFGYKTNPPTALGISDKLAAAYMNQAEYLSWLSPRIRSYDQYLLVDPTDPQTDDFDTGLEKPGQYGVPGATPKPDVYDAYRLPLWLPKTSGTKGQKLTVWGCARPVNDAGRPSATVDIQFATSGAFHTLKAVTLHPASSGCYFDTTVSFPASGTVRLSYGSGAGAITSRTQAVSIG